MKEPVNIDERISALLDGRLNEAEREALLAHLADAGDDFDVFARTAANLRAMEEEDALIGHAGPVADPDDAVIPDHPAPPTRPQAAPAGVIPLRPRAPAWRRPAVRVAMAACLAALVLAGALLFRGRGSGAGVPVQLATALDREGLPPGWTDDRPWETTRGDARTSSVQAGVLLVDLAVAIQARDSAQTYVLARQLHGRNFRELGPQSPFTRIIERPGAPRDSLLALLAEGTERLERDGREPLRVGAWLEAARLAADGRDAAFFRTHEVPPAADQLARGNEDAHAALARVRAALPANAPPRWDELRPALRALLSELAG